MSRYRRVYVHGYYGYDNCGDEAFKIFFSEFLKNEDIVFTSPKNPPPHCSDGEFLILGGGNVVDNFFLDGIDTSWKGSMMALGIGLNNISALRRLAALSPRLCVVRNKNEIEIFQSVIHNAIYAPDLILDLAPESLSKSGAALPGLQELSESRLKKAVVVLSDRLTSFLASGLHQDPCLSSFAISAIARISQYLKFLCEYYELHFVAFTDNFYHRDDAVNSLVGSSLIGKHDNIAYYCCSNSPSLGYKLIREADLLISSKFHSAIFALLAGTPYINISDAEKCTSLMSNLGLDRLSFPLISEIPNLERLTEATKMAESLDISKYREFVDSAKSSILDVKAKAIDCLHGP